MQKPTKGLTQEVFHPTDLSGKRDGNGLNLLNFMPQIKELGPLTTNRIL